MAILSLRKLHLLLCKFEFILSVERDMVMS